MVVDRLRTSFRPGAGRAHHGAPRVLRAALALNQPVALHAREHAGEAGAEQQGFARNAAGFHPGWIIGMFAQHTQARATAGPTGRARAGWDGCAASRPRGLRAAGGAGCGGQRGWLAHLFNMLNDFSTRTPIQGFPESPATTRSAPQWRHEQPVDLPARHRASPDSGTHGGCTRLGPGARREPHRRPGLPALRHAHARGPRRSSCRHCKPAPADR